MVGGPDAVMCPVHCQSWGTQFYASLRHSDPVPDKMKSINGGIKKALLSIRLIYLHVTQLRGSPLSWGLSNLNSGCCLITFLFSFLTPSSNSATDIDRYKWLISLPAIHFDNLFAPIHAGADSSYYGSAGDTFIIVLFSNETPFLWGYYEQVPVFSIKRLFSLSNNSFVIYVQLSATYTCWILKHSPLSICI